MTQLIDAFCQWPVEAQYYAAAIAGSLLLAVAILLVSGVNTLVRTLLDFVVALFWGWKPDAEVEKKRIESDERRAQIGLSQQGAITMKEINLGPIATTENRKLPQGGSVGKPPPPIYVLPPNNFSTMSEVWQERRVLVHADGGDCHGTPLVNGKCPKCGIAPDVQSTGLWPADQLE